MSAFGTRPTLEWGTFYRSKPRDGLRLEEWLCSAPSILSNFGQYGRHRTNVLGLDGVNTMRVGRLDELAMHPTVKPVAMVADADQGLLEARQSCSRSILRQWDKPDRRGKEPADAPGQSSLTQSTSMSRLGAGTLYGQDRMPSAYGEILMR